MSKIRLAAALLFVIAGMFGTATVAAAPRATISAPDAVMGADSYAILSSPLRASEYVWTFCYQNGIEVVQHISDEVIVNADGTATTTLVLDPFPEVYDPDAPADCVAFVGTWWRHGDIRVRSSDTFTASAP